MSTSVIRQSLQIVDSDPNYKRKNKKDKRVFSLVPENLQCISKVQRKGSKAQKIGLPVSKKYTVIEAKQFLKSKSEILKTNKKKLEAIRQYSSIELDNNLTKQIIERGVSKRPIKKKSKSKSSQKTAFTEEDFKKFEEEYVDD